MSKLGFKKVRESAEMPTYGDGIFTLYANNEANSLIPVGSNEIIRTGIAVDVPDNTIILVSIPVELMGPNTGLVLAEGTMFLSQRNSGKEIQLKIANTSTTGRVVREGAPIAEFVVVPISKFNLGVVDDKEETE